MAVDDTRLTPSMTSVSDPQPCGPLPVMAQPGGGLPDKTEVRQARRDVVEEDLATSKRLALFTGGADGWGEVLLARLAAAIPRSNGKPDAADPSFMASLIALGGIKPKDPIEAMLISQIISAHAASLDLYRRAWTAEQPFEVRTKFLSLADRSARTVAVLAESLAKLRNGGKQTVVVQHVNVGEGGQAVVAGEINADRGRQGGGQNER
jgi:hypothetical protein